MENILNFLENNYIWFLIAAVVLLIALVGFIVDSKMKAKKKEGNFGTLDNNVNQGNPVEAPAEMNNAEIAPNPATVNLAENTAMNDVTPAENTTPDINLNSSVTPESSETLSFNDVPAPQTNFEMPSVTPEEPKEEIIEPFNLGNPVVMNESPAPVAEPVMGSEAAAPVVNEEVKVNPEPMFSLNPDTNSPVNTIPTTEPAQVIEEPAVSISEPVQTVNPVETNDEPIVKIE